MTSSPEPEAATPGKPVGSKDLSPKTVAVVLGLVLAVVAGVAAFAMRGAEITGWFQVRGWDKVAPSRLVTDWVRNAHNGNGRAAAAAMRPDFYTPVYEGDRLTAVRWMASGGPTTTPITQWAPVGEVKSTEAELRHRADVSYFLVSVEFGNGKWGVFRVQPVKGKLYIHRFPEYLGNERPKHLEGD
jgi:hypothetical protein